MVSLDPGVGLAERNEAGRGASRKLPWGSALQFVKHGEEERVAGGIGRPWIGHLFTVCYGGGRAARRAAGGAVSPKVWLGGGKGWTLRGPKMKGPAELEGIASEFVLVMAGGAGTFAAYEIVSAEEMEEVGGFEIGDF